MPPNLLANLLTITYDQIQACMGTYHSARFVCTLLPWKPTYFEQFIYVGHILGLIVPVIAHNIKKDMVVLEYSRSVLFTLLYS